MNRFTKILAAVAAAMSLLCTSAFADEAAATTAGGGGGSMIIMIVLMIVVFYFFLIRPENKKKKQAEELRNSITVGDTITTIGGIMGRVVYVKENSIVFETSEDRVRMEVTKWAISSKGKQTEEQK